MVCLSVGHVRELCKNRWTDRDAVWDTDWDGPRNHVLEGCSDLQQEGTLFRLSVPQETIVIVSCATAAKPYIHTIHRHFQAANEWIIRARGRCGLLSYYFDHLLVSDSQLQRSFVDNPAYLGVSDVSGLGSICDVVVGGCYRGDGDAWFSNWRQILTVYRHQCTAADTHTHTHTHTCSTYGLCTCTSNYIVFLIYCTWLYKLTTELSSDWFSAKAAEKMFILGYIPC